MSRIKTEEWFRPPKIHRMGSFGDTYRYLLVAEPVMKEGVYGVGFEVAASFVEEEPLVMHAIGEAAYSELFRRIEAGEKNGEGSDWASFRWNTIFKRLENGTVEVVPG